METEEGQPLNQLQLMQSYTMDIRDFAYERDLRLRHTKYPVLTSKTIKRKRNIIGNIIFNPQLILRYQIYLENPTLFRVELIEGEKRKVRFIPFVEIYGMIEKYHREIILGEEMDDKWTGKEEKEEEV